MDLQKFIKHLPSFPDQDSVDWYSKFDRFELVLEQIEERTTVSLMQLLNLAVGCLEPDEVYCEVGCSQGANLIAALLGHSDCMAYAVDDFSKYPESGAYLEKLAEHLSIFELQEQVLVCNQSVEAFFSALQEVGITDRIGIYVDCESQDYRTQLMSLLLAKPFLSDAALIVLAHATSPNVQQAIKDFIKTHPSCHLLQTLPDFIDLNGFSILCWGTPSNLKHSSNYVVSQPESSAKLDPEAEVDTPADLSDYYNSVNLDLLAAIPPNARLVVEVGCGAGALGAEYKHINPNGQYTGIELSSIAAKIARRRLDRVVVGDVEHLNPTALQLANDTVDCLVYGDVLEHLVDPWTVLQQQTAWLRDGGQVVTCIPNIQHWSIILHLFKGQWEYQAEGLLDRTHLRFFTLDGIATMFHNSGLQILNIQARCVANPPEQFLPASTPLLEVLNIDPDNFSLQTNAYQYIVRAVKSTTPPRRLLIYTRTTHTICKLVRVLQPDHFSATIPGVRTVQTLGEIDVNIAHPDEDKVFIWQRPFLDYPLETKTWMAIQEALLQAGYLVVVELDDLPSAWSEAVQTSFLRFLRTCHGVQTSTQSLADYLRPHNPNVVVFQNQLASLPQLRVAAVDGPITLFFGAQNREQDWEPLMPALNQVLSDHSNQVHVRVIHDRHFFEALDTDQKQFEPWCAYSQYLEILQSCDIGLLPLGPTEFNSMKSDLKLIECAAHGVVALASPTVYAASIVDGQTGLIYNSAEEFAAKLRELIVNRKMRCRVAIQAYNWVRSHRLLSQHYHQRREWYLQMCDKLPELNYARWKQTLLD